ncbi:hypothetical protein P3X46_030914 [Hevea brasiliensis]|uniref:Cytochrome P450 n=1 Tax=Hevea brasiliensis TaxID=3981 RepID=A0ABQ9KJM8_HEVBR|nr:hypothetical protein P3X46_030914 [Hevea brasiliensis]
MLSYVQPGTSSLLLPLSFTILALCFIVFLLKRYPLRSKKTLPPCPPGLPIIGNLHQIGLHPHRSLRSLAQTHGDIMLLHLGSVPVLVISSAEMAREVLKTHDLVFADRPKSRMNGKLLYDQRDVAAAPYGEYWRQMKSLCVLHLLSTKRVQSFRDLREEETAYMIERVKKSCSSSPINLSEVFARLTNGVVCRSALGRKYNAAEGGTKFKELLGEFGELLGCFDVGDYISWLGWINHVNGLYARAEKVAKEFDDFLERVVQEHITGSDDGRHENNRCICRRNRHCIHSPGMDNDRTPKAPRSDEETPE